MDDPERGITERGRDSGKLKLRPEDMSIKKTKNMKEPNQKTWKF